MFIIYIYRCLKESGIKNGYSKTPYNPRKTWNVYNTPHQSTKNTKLTLCATRRNTIVFCNCDGEKISKEVTASMPCVIVMCRTDDRDIPELILRQGTSRAISSDTISSVHSSIQSDQGAKLLSLS